MCYQCRERCNGERWHPAMAPHHHGTQQWHPTMATYHCTLPWHPTNGTPPWHPAMAHSNGTQQWHPAMAPYHGTPPMAPHHGTQQWHTAMAPSNGTPAMAPSIGTQWHPALAPNGTAAMAPSNGTKVGAHPPLLLEVRTPIAKAIWGKNVGELWARGGALNHEDVTERQSAHRYMYIHD